ncbi:MAG: oxaloacetate decarboxylase subunit alpha, partial [Eubacteriales bacterium]|nr:oxaloacetate decarboxylase subunit alpha [Eubacteriales bacterium]
KYEAEIKEYKRQDEDVLSYALFPAVAKEFFEYRNTQDDGIDPKKCSNGAYPV